MSIMIGLETHVQLNSKSKIFCGCANPVTVEGKNSIKPNTLTCPTCLGMPGSKPRMNAKIIDSAIKAALALNCKIAGEIYFSRKTYFYPDMSKNFQTTQYEIPLAEEGMIELNIAGKKKKIRIRRVHIEEDPAKLVHQSSPTGGYTLVDYNRAGTPLIEVVTEPDFTSPEEARLYLQKIGQIFDYLGIYDFASEASLKSDGNLSIDGGKRVEVKNITGTREIEKALNYEAIRQRNVVRGGGKIVQESRQWNPQMGVTKMMRTKETEEDYGYIFEPDLTKIEIPKQLIDKLKKELPELPDERQKRFIKQYKMHEKEAEKLTSEKAIADVFEKAAKMAGAKVAAGWLSGPLKKTLNYNDMSYSNSGLKDEWVIGLLVLFAKKEYTDHVTEKILRKMVELKIDEKSAAKKLGLGKIEDKSLIKDVVGKIIKTNADAVRDYRSGNEKALHFLVGQVMRETKGQVDANTAKKHILEELK